MADAIERRSEAVDRVQKLGPIARQAHPTYDHFLPVLYSLALRGPGEEAVLFNRGIDLGSVSMLSFRLG
ncbi:MAG: hypothetical protein R3E97_14710 [Candidatus Eisenbacteria bacterium]